MLLRRYHKREEIIEEKKIEKEKETIEEQEEIIKKEKEQSSVDNLDNLTVVELKELAKNKEIPKYYDFNKEELIEKLKE